MSAISLIRSALLVEASAVCEVGRYAMRVRRAGGERPHLTVLRRTPEGAWLRALEVYKPDAQEDL